MVGQPANPGAASSLPVLPVHGVPVSGTRGGSLVSVCSVSGRSVGGTVFCIVSYELGLSFSRLYRIHSLLKPLRPQHGLSSFLLPDHGRCSHDC